MARIQKIIKRDGRIATFDQTKITEAIFKAAEAVGGIDEGLADQISNQVSAVLEVFFKTEDDIPTVEQIQDLVEKILIEGGHAKTAKAYILYRHKRKEEREAKEAILGKGQAHKNLNFSTNALTVLQKRYLLKDEDGELIESPEDLLRRVAKSVAIPEKDYGGDVKEIEEKFFNMMKDLEFMPNSPTLMNAGTKLGQLSACFVLPVADSMEHIFEALKNAALIHKSGGGTGYSFTRLRPSNDIVRSTAGISSGPISFMKVFDAATEVIKQGGRRRGANMGILRVDHPDIMDFINCKADMKTLTNFNISVAITDKFMEALKNNEEYELLNPRDKTPMKKLKARMVFDIILANAWKNGDPGLIFIDTINKKNVCKHLGDIEATNPCGEQPLLPFESCNLGSINLNKAIKADLTDLDWDKLKETIHLAVRFLDNVIDVNHYPIPEIGEMSRKTRKIGLGVMGFADILFQLGIKYDSEEGVAMGEKVMKFVNDEAKIMSQSLVEKRGTFPAYEGSEHEKNGVKTRNACVTTVAPTGTIGMLAEASGGLEPNFAISFIKTVMDGTELVYVNKYFENVAKKAGFFSQELMRKIAQKGSIQDFDEIPEEVKEIFVTAMDITPEWHLRMQAAFQKHVDSSVSKTINFPGEASMDDVEESYMRAYDLGCKGVTIYRDGSRDGQVLSTGNAKKKEKAKKESEGKVNVEAQAAVAEIQEQSTHSREHSSSVSAISDTKAEEVSLPPLNDGDITSSAEEFELPPISTNEITQDQEQMEFAQAKVAVMDQPKQMTKSEILKSGKCPECGTRVQIGEGCMLCLSCGFSACSV